MLFNKINLRMCWRFFALSIILVSCSPPNNQNGKLIYSLNDYPISRLVWSPSGKQLAFSSVSVSKNKSSLYVLDVEKSEARLFIQSEYGWTLPQTWTPDGKSLLFNADSSNEFEDGIWVVDASGVPSPKLLLQDVISVAWSSTNQLAIARRNSNELVVSIRDMNENKETVLFSEEAIAISSLVWSADGSKLAFSLDHGEFRRSDIYVIDVKTKQLLQITNDGRNESPSLSQNGKLVVYVKGNFSGSFPSYSLRMMNADGTCDMEVPGFVDVSVSTWSPDGSQIAFVGKGNRIFLLNVVQAFGQNVLAEGLSC